MRKSEAIAASGPLHPTEPTEVGCHDGSALQDEATSQLQRAVQLQDDARWQFQMAEHTYETIRDAVAQGSARAYAQEPKAADEANPPDAAARLDAAPRRATQRPKLALATLACAALAITTGLIVSLQAATTPAPSKLADAALTSVAVVSAPVTAQTTTAPVAAVDADLGRMIYAARFAKAPAIERTCLARAVYYEARGEAIDGQIAVAQVILNRARSRKWPGTICGVVNQGVERGEKCQFSFACFQHLSQPAGEMWEQAKQLADQALTGQSWLRELVDATHYHATGVAPVWRLGLNEIATIGTHVFYREGEGVRASPTGAQAYQASAAALAVRAKVAAVVKAAKPGLAMSEATDSGRPKLATKEATSAVPKKASASTGSDWKASVFQN